MIDYEIGSFQPNNPYKDLILLPYFSGIVRTICVLRDEKRFLIGDDMGNLTIWNENGNLISNLKFHTSSIVSIVKFLDSKLFQNYIAVSSIDKHLSVS